MAFTPLLGGIQFVLTLVAVKVKAARAFLLFNIHITYKENSTSNAGLPVVP
jgi:hypothetical protein